MKTIEEITTTAIIGPLLFFGRSSPSEHKEGFSIRLSHIISEALYAVKYSACRIPLTDKSGKLIIPVLTYNQIGRAHV